MELYMEHISKQFKDLKAVDDVSLHITPGVWGLLGANGAGKTTLMRIIAGIMAPSSGEILYDGIPIRELKESYRDVFGYLPQEFGFYPEFTVKDYLEYVAVLKGLTPKDSKRRIHELLEQMTLSHVRNKKIIKLSGGMKQRIVIAIALACNPNLLIADEPTTALDVTIQLQIVKLLQRLNQEKKMAVLFISHDLSLVKRLCDRVIVMHNGSMVETGKTEEIFYSPKEDYTIKLISAIPKLEKLV